jgi:hypothetical protein
MTVLLGAATTRLPALSVAAASFMGFAMKKFIAAIMARFAPAEPENESYGMFVVGDNSPSSDTTYSATGDGLCLLDKRRYTTGIEYS